jgi:hypothetical protein
MTKTREIKVSLESVTDLHTYIDTFFPKLASHLKTQKNIKYSFLIDGKSLLPNSWIFQNKIVDTSCDIYVVPTIAGGTADMASAFTNIDFTKLLFQVAVGTAINIGISFIVRALLPKPKKPNEEAVDRKENDIFGSIVNTSDTNTILALNYGMIRIGGQTISSDLETVTDQRVPDPVTEPEVEEQLGDGGYGVDSNNFGFSVVTTYGLNDITFEGPSNPGNAATPTSTTDFGGTSQTPDQF